MYEIRKYQPKDLESIVKICLSTTADVAMQNAILFVFCRYYLNHEPDNCFVAVDDNKEILGYVLCASDFTTWEKTFRSEILLENDPLVSAMGNATIENLRPYATQFPAHLHIDLSSKAQGKGIGTALLQTLFMHLQTLGINGIMLDVAKDNSRAINFYLKNGFAHLSKSGTECLMGKTL